MKELAEMSWSELTKLREQLQKGLGYDQEDETDGEGTDYDDAEDDFSDTRLTAALTELVEVKEAKQPSVKKGAPKSAPKGYPSDKGKYADPTNFKYPLDTEAHVRAALSYFSKPANRKKGSYSAEEQKFMWKRILAAAKKFNIQLSPDVLKHGEMLGALDSNSEGEGVKEELNEKEIVELIEKTIREQLPQNPGGTLAQGTKGHGGMEAYQPQARVPPDIEAINSQLENFKQLHAAHEATGTYVKSKLSALQKQVGEMQEAFEKMQKGMQATAQEADDSADDTAGETEEADSPEDTSDSDTAEDLEEAKSAKAAKPANAAKPKKTGKDDEEEDTEEDSEEDSDSESPYDSSDQKSEEFKKKESLQPHAEGVVATPAMAEGTGVAPPGFTTQDDNAEPKSFGDVMNRATRLRRRGIGAN